MPLPTLSAKSTKILLSTIASAAALVPDSSAFAGAWLQQPGHTQLIITTSYYQADDFLDDHGHRQPQETYRKAEVNPYLEYGLTSRWTLGANLLFQVVSQDDSTTGNPLTNAALGDSEWFARCQLWKSDHAVISLRPFVKLPGLDDSANVPAIASIHPDAGFAVAAGYSFTLYGLPAFVDGEFGYRYRFGEPHDQLTLAPTFGIRPYEKWLLLSQLFSTWRMASEPAATFTNSPRNDYSLLKTQMSAVYQIDTSYSLQGGFFYNITGKNTGGGGGMILGVWRQF